MNRRFFNRSVFTLLASGLVVPIVSACTLESQAPSFLGHTKLNQHDVLRVSLGKVPLFRQNFGGSSFVDNPTDGSPQSNGVVRLVTFKTSGDWKFDQNNKPTEQPKTDYFLEGSTGFTLYGPKSAAVPATTGTSGAGTVPAAPPAPAPAAPPAPAPQQQAASASPASGGVSNGSGEGVRRAGSDASAATTPVAVDSNDSELLKFTADNNNKGVISGTELTKFQTTIAHATKIVFDINTNIPWFDSETKTKKNNLSSLDFIDAFKLFTLASQIGVNPNGYLLSLIGIDWKKTFDDKENLSPTGSKLTLYLNQGKQNPFMLDQLTANFFAAAPSANPEIKALLNVSPKNDTGFVFVKDGRIDYARSNLEKIYGWGKRQQEGAHGWWNGAYLLDNTSLQDVVFTANKAYFENVKYAGDYKDKIKKVILYYGNLFANPDQIYQGYLTNEIDYVGLSQNDLKNDAFERFVNQKNTLRASGYGQISSDSDLWWNTNIYSNGQLKTHIDPSYATFVKKFWSDDAINVRKGINSLINYPKLAAGILFEPGNYDLRISNVPYGNLSVETDEKPTNKTSAYQLFYENQKYDVSNPYGNKEALKGNFEGILGNKFEVYQKDFNSSKSSQGYLLKSLSDFSTKKTQFIDSLKHLGYSAARPLKLNFVASSQQLTEAQSNYYTQWTKAVTELSNNLISFDPILPRTQAVQAVWNANGYELGFSGWGLDYRSFSNWTTRPIGYADGKDDPKKTGKQVADLDSTPIEKDAVNKGFKNFMAIAQLWPRLFDELKKHKDDNTNGTSGAGKGALTAGTPAAAVPKTPRMGSWQQNLWDFLMEKGVFANSDPKYSDVDPSELPGVISQWMIQNDYNGITMVNWVDQQYIQIPYPERGYFSRIWYLARPYFHVPNPTYMNRFFRDWSIVDPNKATTK